MQKKDFFLCGFTGWCLEIIWTGLHSLFTGHFTMMGKTSLLMFPVYGLAAVIRPACPFSGYDTRSFLQLRDFSGGIPKRFFLPETSYLPLGLFSCSAAI